MLSQEPVYSHQNISRLTGDLCPPNVRHTACWWQINTPDIWVPSFSFLFIFLPPFLAIYIYTSLCQTPKTCEPDKLYGWQQTPHPRLLPTTWLMEPCHNGERWSPCRGVALCAQISSPQYPQSVFHQNKAILNFYCINWILKDRSTKNGNSVSIYSPLRCSNQYDFFVLWNTKEAILKNKCSFGPHWLALNGQKQLKYLPKYILYRSQGWNNDLGCKCELSYVNVPIMMSQSV